MATVMFELESPSTSPYVFHVEAMLAFRPALGDPRPLEKNVGGVENRGRAACARPFLVPKVIKLLGLQTCELGAAQHGK